MADNDAGQKLQFSMARPQDATTIVSFQARLILEEKFGHRNGRRLAQLMGYACGAPVPGQSSIDLETHIANRAEVFKGCRRFAQF